MKSKQILERQKLVLKELQKREGIRPCMDYKEYLKQAWNRGERDGSYYKNLYDVQDNWDEWIKSRLYQDE